MNNLDSREAYYKQLTSELEEAKNKIREKNDEIVKTKSQSSKLELELQSHQQKVNSLLSDKNLLEQEIEAMQNEFASICDKLNKFEDRDLMMKS